MEESQIPEGCKGIYLAKISGDIIRIKYNKKYKEQFSVEEVYKDKSEKEKDSYLIQVIRKKIGLDKSEEEFKITKIEKIKLIGYSNK